MTENNAEQPALDGLTRRARKSKITAKVPAAVNPVARVILDVQAEHLGGTFDYLVEEKLSEVAQPGTPVRVRFGNRRVNGIIWERVKSSSIAHSTLKFIDRVVGNRVILNSHMRDDITAIAQYFGGTRANIIRLAVPPRVAKVDKEVTAINESVTTGAFAGSRYGNKRRAYVEQKDSAETERILSSYSNAGALVSSVENAKASTVVWDTLPGQNTWLHDMGWLIMHSLLAGRSIVLVVPDVRHITHMGRHLVSMGMKAFAKNPSTGTFAGDFVALAGGMAPEERYRSYMAVVSGCVKCVIGTRAAMYAPVDGPAVFAIVDDIVYQNTDGFTPYANARDVLRLRAKNHHGFFVAMGNVRSPQSEWDAQGNADNLRSGALIDVHGLSTVVRESSAWSRWLNRKELDNLGDMTKGARVPRTALAVLTRALEKGPILFSVPHDAQSSVLSCATCHKQAKCRRCIGPLKFDNSGSIRCTWCNAPAGIWECSFCGGARVRELRVGAAGTAQELHHLFPHTPIVISSPHSRASQGSRLQGTDVVDVISDKPQVVIATPGSEPLVKPVKIDGEPTRPAGYQAVAILDAWTSLYSFGIDARVDTLIAWSRCAAMCVSRTHEGQVLLIGESDETIAQSLVAWDSRILARQELVDRKNAALPPAFAAATIWGERKAVLKVLDSVGAAFNIETPDSSDFAVIKTELGDMPAVLGPVPIAPPSTVTERYLEGANDRVRAVIRVDSHRIEELAHRLHSAVAHHAASRLNTELHFQINPKSLI